MRFRSQLRISLALFVGLAPLVRINGNPSASEDECSRTAKMRIYSNAFFSKEAGDVVGYELALTQPNGNAIDARLYIYQGEPNDEGISMSGQISEGKLSIEGSWVQHVIEYPSKKEIVETQFVTVDGILDSAGFRGAIKVQGVANPIKVRLKRANHIWICKQ